MASSVSLTPCGSLFSSSSTRPHRPGHLGCSLRPALEPLGLPARVPTDRQMPPSETQPGPQAHLTELLVSIRDPGLPAALVALVSHVCLIQFSTCSTILKEINPEYSLEGLMLKLKPQFSGHLMGRADSLDETGLIASLTQ